MTEDEVLRKELTALLTGGQAHLGFQAVEGFPHAEYNTHIPNMDYTFWHLLEHIRVAQRDILDFMIDPDYKELRWPEDYWPAKDSVCTDAEWQITWNMIQADQSRLCLLVNDPSIKLTSPLPNTPKYTYLREILLVADHNAYHLGEFAIARGILGLW